MVGHGELKEASGFAISFQQREQPVVLRLQDRPIHETCTEDVQQAWLRPSDDSRLLVLSLSEASLTLNPDALQLEYQKLDALKIQLGELHRQLRAQEGKIYLMLKQDFRSCNSIKCLVEMAMRKAPEFGQLLTTHFQHHPHGDFDGHKAAHKNCSRDPQEANEHAPMLRDELDSEKLDSNTLAAEAVSPHESVLHDDHIPLDDKHQPFHDLPHGQHHPPPWGHGPPGRQGPPGLHPPHPHRHLHRRHSLLMTAALLFVVTVAAASAFEFIKRNTTFLRDPQRRVDRAARREERRTRRAYRRAAYHQKWRNWWSRYTRPSSTDNYDEKRAVVLEQEGVLEGIMQEEIRSLRVAHQLAGEMVRAEEGRTRLYYEVNLQPSQRYTPAELEAGLGSSRNGLLTAYNAPPPRYEEEFDGELTVVDGFQYTPSDTDFVPESSIFDCSSRLSFDTGTTKSTRS